MSLSSRCKIRGRLDTDSDLPWTLIPKKFGQSFRFEVDTDSGLNWTLFR